MKINREDHCKIIIGDNEKGFITSSSVEANLLYAILEKLEEIRCFMRDIRKIKC